MANSSPAAILVAASAQALKDRADEVNKLNVFPVPDGDTGTNMSLTMEAVVSELARLDPGAGLSEVCKAITHGSLMGARGNSGVILSQILRGLCEVVGEADNLDAALVT
ncbi:DAK2 domain-containing protein, partial [bacterium]|nr:DAK2 domain-containing protein [bacterium]